MGSGSSEVKALDYCAEGCEIPVTPPGAPPGTLNKAVNPQLSYIIVQM